MSAATPQPLIRRLDTAAASFEADFAALRHWSAETDAAIEATVAAIVDDVRRRGDAALLHYTARFDGLRLDSAAALEIPADALEAALRSITPAQRAALTTAAERVRQYHERQRQHSALSWAYADADGSWLGQKVTPLDRVGIYVPGGKAAYPSSVLMNAIPAQVAGVAEIIMVVPTPDRGAGPERNPLVLAAARLAGVHRVFGVGGAQAVAALAWGTATVPRVDKITGPGNAYVASAKRRVFGQVGIDMIAGPSEILVLADGTTPPDWVAMDLFSQAEHDELAQSILLCPDAGYLDAVQAAIERLLPTLPRRAVVEASLRQRGALVLTRSMDEACEISNRLAPEHLEICAAEPARWEPLLQHAGAIFLGRHTSEALGDYCAGPNHVLPTAGTARFSSPLGVYDFVKRSSLIEVSQAGAQQLGAVASVLAHGEGLQAHAMAAEMRRVAAGQAFDAAAAQAAALADVQAAANAGAATGGEGRATLEVADATAADLDALRAMVLAPGQERLVTGPVLSIAQAALTPGSRTLALRVAGRAVGLLLTYDCRQRADKPVPYLGIWRLMVDARWQRHGLGRQAIAWAVAEARRLGLRAVELSHMPVPGHAGPFYQGLGFAYTGEFDEDELVMRLDIDEGSTEEPR